MTRITGDAATEIDKSALRAIHLVRLDFSSAPVLAHDGVGTISYGGEDYVGVGQLGSVQTVTEDITFRPQSIQLSLSGVDAGLVQDALHDEYHMREAVITLMPIDASNTAIGTPAQIWSGYMDVASIELDEGSGVIGMSCMDRLADVGRPKPFYLTDEAHQRRYPGDKGLEFAPQAVRETTVSWGGTYYSAPGAGGDDGDGSGKPRVLP